MHNNAATRPRLKSWALRGKEQLIVEYRDRQELTYEEIAVLFGASRQGIQRAYKRSTERISYIAGIAFVGTVHMVDSKFELKVLDAEENLLYIRGKIETLKKAWKLFDSKLGAIKDSWKT